MAKTRRRSWKLRFSLKAFLLVCLVSGVGVGWISQNYREYLVEQQLIESLTAEVAPGSLVSVATNGAVNSYGGMVVM